MNTTLMNGVYYEITGGMAIDTCMKLKVCLESDKWAKEEAINTERVAYRNTYDSGKRIESVKLWDPYGDEYFSINDEELHYEPLPSVLRYQYMMLSRLQSDCEYFLGNGNGYEPHLWAGSVEKQIKEMRDMWNAFAADEKPEWLTMEQIDEYERNMIQARESRKNRDSYKVSMLEKILEELKADEWFIPQVTAPGKLEKGIRAINLDKGAIKKLIDYYGGCI